MALNALHLSYIPLFSVENKIKKGLTIRQRLLLCHTWWAPQIWEQFNIRKDFRPSHPSVRKTTLAQTLWSWEISSDTTPSLPQGLCLHTHGLPSLVTPWYIRLVITTEDHAASTSYTKGEKTTAKLKRRYALEENNVKGYVSGCEEVSQNHLYLQKLETVPDLVNSKIHGWAGPLFRQKKKNINSTKLPF